MVNLHGKIYTMIQSTIFMFLLHFRRRLLCFVYFFLFFAAFSVKGQGGLSLQEYVDTYKHIAMEEMRLHGIPASIKLGQGILESGFGNSDLAVIANNHFGIKCHGWQGRTFHKDDDEEDECFRAYDDPLQSFRDHSEFLTGRPRYADLFRLEITDYKGWARGLSRAGYATNPRYPQLLIGVIERNNLYEFDRLVVEGGEYQRPVAARTTRQTNRNENLPDVDARRQMHENNRIRYVYAQRGDTPQSLAKEVGVWTWEIYRYNEMSRSDRLTEGQIVYLQPKRRNASESWHVVQEGETLYDISQKYGVRIRVLQRRNSLPEGAELIPGQRIQLRARPRR